LGRKAVSEIMLILLTMSMVSLTINIQQVKSGWTGTVYIRADGSIDPPDAPIQRDGNVYTLTGNITSDTDGIVVERDNTVIDGAGCAVQGMGGYETKGVDLLGISNVTIKNINIKGFVYGIRLYSSSNNTLYRNSIELNKEFGIYLYNSHNNTISENKITDTYGYTDSKGILLMCSSNNVIDENIVTKNDDGGIMLRGSSNNMIIMNNISDNDGWGIDLTYCSMWDGCYPTRYSNNNTIMGNSVTKNFKGIRLRVSWYNILNANTITNNSRNGVLMETASQNILRNNILAGNKYNFGVFTFHNEVRLSTYTQDIDTSNTVDGKPIYYLIKQNGLIIDSSNIGYLALVNSTNIHIKDVTLINNGQGLLLAFTTNSTIENVTITNNYIGIHVLSSDANLITASNITNNAFGISLYCSSSNNITNNTLTNNGGYNSGFYYGCILIGRLVLGESVLETSTAISSEDNVISSNIISNNGGSIVLTNPGTRCTIIDGNTISKNGEGIYLAYTSNNKIYHNNFIDNNKQVYIDATRGAVVNVWDDGYPFGGNYWSNYTGVDSNGDGIGDAPYIIDEDNADRYPLMGPFNSFNTSVGCSVDVISNSTVEDFRYFESNSTIVMYVSNMTADQTVGFCRLAIPHDVMSPPYTVKVNGTTIEYQTIYENHTEGISIIYFAYEHSKLEITIIPEFPITITTLLLMLIVISIVPVKRKVLRRKFPT